MRFDGVAEALAEPDTDLRLFAKPEVVGQRRLGVALAQGDSVDQARAKARAVIAKINVVL